MKTQIKKTDVVINTETLTALANAIELKIVDCVEKGPFTRGNFRNLPTMITEVLSDRNVSLSKKKKVKNRVIGLMSKITLNRLNKLMDLIGSEIRVLPSVKEQRIMEFRKSFVEARNKMEESLKRYKEEKGDYYKNRV